MSKTKLCIVPGCGRIRKAHGLCDPHYDRLRLHGDAMADKPIRAPTRRIKVRWMKISWKGPIGDAEKSEK